METSVIFPFEKDIPDVRDTGGIHPFSTFNSSTARLREVRAIVAMGLGNEIGFRGDMPWHIPEDLRHFKELTMGHPVIMGRATWLSLPRRPLPGRRNIILTRQPGFTPTGPSPSSRPSTPAVPSPSSRPSTPPVPSPSSPGSTAQPGELGSTSCGATTVAHPIPTEVASSIAAAVAMCPPPEVPYIIGGGQVYAAAMPILTHIDVTRIEARFPEADTRFPELSETDWILTDRSEPITSRCGLTFRYETYTRR